MTLSLTSNNIFSILDVFASFDVQTFVEIIEFGTLNVPASVFTEKISYSQEENVEDVGFDEWGNFVTSEYDGELGDIILEVIDEWGNLITQFPSYDDTTAFITADEVMLFEEYVRYEDDFASFAS